MEKIFSRVFCVIEGVLIGSGVVVLPFLVSEVKLGSDERIGDPTGIVKYIAVTVILYQFFKFLGTFTVFFDKVEQRKSQANYLTILSVVIITIFGNCSSYSILTSSRAVGGLICGCVSNAIRAYESNSYQYSHNYWLLGFGSSSFLSGLLYISAAYSDQPIKSSTTYLVQHPALISSLACALLIAVLAITAHYINWYQRPRSYPVYEEHTSNAEESQIITNPLLETPVRNYGNEMEEHPLATVSVNHVREFEIALFCKILGVTTYFQPLV